ncbi:unnamed protein product, partial [Polarella glacialis]
LITAGMIIGVAEAGLGGGFLGNIALELQDDLGVRSLFGGGPPHPLCDSASHAQCLQGLQGLKSTVAGCICLSSRGWDARTLGTVFADLSNAVSS